MQHNQVNDGQDEWHAVAHADPLGSGQEAGPSDPRSDAELQGGRQIHQTRLDRTARRREHVERSVRQDLCLPRQRACAAVCSPSNRAWPQGHVHAARGLSHNLLQRHAPQLRSDW